jgi:hypothetical protein
VTFRQFSFFRGLRQRVQKRRRRSELQRKSDGAYRLFESALAGADTWEKREHIETQRRLECSKYDDEIQRMDSFELAARARKCRIDVSAVGPPPEPHHHHWIQGVHGTWFLHEKSFKALTELVEAAEYQRRKRRSERREFWWKRITAVAAVVAAAASIASLVKHC